MIIPLFKEKEPEDEVTLSGEAHCMQCKHEWAASVPVGVTWLECPECHSMKGMLKYTVQRDGLEWHCKCGCDLFKMTPDGFYCPNCGEWQTGF